MLLQRLRERKRLPRLLQPSWLLVGGIQFVILGLWDVERAGGLTPQARRGEAWRGGGDALGLLELHWAWRNGEAAFG